MAVAVHPDFEYAKVRMKGASGEETVYVLESQAEYVMQKGGYESFEVLERMKGKDMEGMEYIPPFENENVPKSEWTFRVVTADYVEKDNTGLVHTAPGHGPDDYETGKRYGIAPFCPVAENGRYTDEFPLMAGKKVKTVADVQQEQDQAQVRTLLEMQVPDHLQEHQAVVHHRARHQGRDAVRDRPRQMGPRLGRLHQGEELGRGRQGLVHLQTEVLGDPHARLGVRVRREEGRRPVRGAQGWRGVHGGHGHPQALDRRRHPTTRS